MYLQPRTFRNETVAPSYLSNRDGNQEHVYLIIVFAENAFAVIIQFIYTGYKRYTYLLLFYDSPLQPAIYGCVY